jgi:hypothetical protein
MVEHLLCKSISKLDGLLMFCEVSITELICLMHISLCRLRTGQKLRCCLQKYLLWDF